MHLEINERAILSDWDRRWTILTAHGALLVHLADWPDSTILQAALTLGFRERYVASVVADLRAASYIEVERRGRRNHYAVNRRAPLDRTHRHLTVGDLLFGLTSGKDQVGGMAAK
jgi:hypothetical protein